MPAEQVFYFASTGRCGTRPLALILGTAANATVIHEPPPFCYEEGFRLADLYSENWDAFLREDTADSARYPELAKKSREHEEIATPVYGQTLNSLFPFCVHFHRQFQARGVGFKCVHLLRDPVATASSILRAERPERGEGGWRRYRAASFIPEDRPAPEIAAAIWCRINQMILDQLEHIDDGGNTRRVWIDDLDVEGYRGLFDWLGLEGFDTDRVRKLLHDERFAVRHSHQWDLDRKGQPSVTPEEREAIRAITDPFVRDVLGEDPARFAVRRREVPAINFANQAFKSWNGRRPADWQSNRPRRLRRETKDTFDGGTALRVHGPGGLFRKAGYVNVFQYVEAPAAAAGHTLTLRSQVKAFDPDTALIKIHLEHEGWKAAASAPHPGNGKWEMLVAEIAVPASFRGGRIKVEGIHRNVRSGPALFDGFTVTAA